MGKNISLQPEETFYDSWKFYKWQFDGARDVIRYQTIYNDNNVFKTNFHQTKPLTVRNYFEGGDGRTILFGEKDFDVISRNSPFNENAFRFQLQVVEAIYRSEASLTHTNLFGTNWNFVKWENNSQNRIREEQVDDNTSPEWKAMYKGQLTSDDLEGLSSNSQRKLVRTDDGIYHLVYEYR